MNILTELKDRFRDALAGALIDDSNINVDELLSMIRPAQNAQFGDYQANFAMPLGKRLGRPPRDVAADVIGQVQLSDLCQPPEIAGPGFINLKLLDRWIVEHLEAARTRDDLLCPPTEHPKTFIVDYSSPNVAKPLHVGHVRSTVIGDALCRILRFHGHQVISDNHLGDWGTQFGMIIYGYRHFVDAVAYRQAPIDELGRLYKLVRKLMDYFAGRDSLPQREAELAEQKKQLEQARAADPDPDPKLEKKRQKSLRKAAGDVHQAEHTLAQLRESLQQVEHDDQLATLLTEHSDVRASVLAETAKLHQGDRLNHSLWEEFLPKCRDAIQSIYSRLDIQFDQELGESFYHDRLADVVQKLRENDLARDSEGAVCVFLDGFETPFIVQKKDGAFLYATTDLATIEYRIATWNPDAILYVVDFRQSEHFDKLFATARQLGQTNVELTHVKFGTVLGEDGKPYKTRSGDTVGLAGLLNEAEQRAYEVVAANDDAKPDGWELDEPTRRHIANTVGMAALKYADLSQNRESDYVFSYDKMLALTGNTATYMQYSYARVFGIFAKGDILAEQLRQSDATIELPHAAERELGLKLLQFGDAIEEVLADYRPNQLTSYLFDLAKAFSAFFEQCPVLKADNDEVRNSRLLLCDLTARTLKLGLSLLGIQVVEKM